MGVSYHVTPTGQSSKSFVLTFSSQKYLEVKTPNLLETDQIEDVQSQILFVYISIEISCDTIQTTFKFKIDNIVDSKQRFNRALAKWRQLDRHDFEYYKKAIKIFLEEGFTRTFE